MVPYREVLGVKWQENARPILLRTVFTVCVGIAMMIARKSVDRSRRSAVKAGGPKSAGPDDPNVLTPVRRVRVALSSRNKDLVPDGDKAVQLLDVRKALQKELNSEKFLERRLLDVWINETAGAEAGDETIRETCLKEIDRADILIVIVNGNAGWAATPAGIGICHEEFQHAIDRQPGKVYLIQLRFPADKSRGLENPSEVAKSNLQNRAFAEAIGRRQPTVSFAEDRESLRERVREIVVKAIAKSVELARVEIGRGKLSGGEALDWSRLTYDDRKARIEGKAKEYLTELGGKLKQQYILLSMEGEGKREVLFRIHAVPSNFGIAEARERVGRPYLLDHIVMSSHELRDAVGPVHVIACHKKCSEPQVIAFMGHPDLFIVPTAFGFYVFERVSFVQVFFIVGCWNEASVRGGLQSMFDWLNGEGEVAGIVRRAESRAKILHVMSKEIAQHAAE